ncbi:unnamed protein product [Closterium sp. NIES-54]
MEPSDDDTAYDNRPLFPESSSHTETKLVSQDSDDDDETDNEHMLDVPICVSHTLQSGESPSCRTRGRFRQALLSFADPPSSPKKRQRSQQPAPTKEDLDKLDQTIAAEAEVPTNTDIPDAERALGRRFIPSWKQTYSWLSLKYNRVHRQYGMKCSVCSTFAPHTKSPFGRNGVGARDFQKSACKQHDFSKVHLAAMEAERLARGTEVHQRTLVDMLSKDPMMARVVKCMQTAQWCAQKDAPVVLNPDLARFMAMQGCPDMVNYEAYGRYYSRYAFGEFTEVLAQHLSDQQLQDIKTSAWPGREPASRPASPVRPARTSGRGSRRLPPPVPGTHRMSLRPSTAPLHVPLPSPPESSLPALPDPESDSLRAASPTVARLLATAVTDPSFE